jgi:hypothetical protein
MTSLGSMRSKRSFPDKVRHSSAAPPGQAPSEDLQHISPHHSIATSGKLIEKQLGVARQSDQLGVVRQILKQVLDIRMSSSQAASGHNPRGVATAKLMQETTKGRP